MKDKIILTGFLVVLLVTGAAAANLNSGLVFDLTDSNVSLKMGKDYSFSNFTVYGDSVDIEARNVTLKPNHTVETVNATLFDYDMDTGNETNLVKVQVWHNNSQEIDPINTTLTFTGLKAPGSGKNALKKNGNHQKNFTSGGKTIWFNTDTQVNYTLVYNFDWDNSTGNTDDSTDDTDDDDDDTDDGGGGGGGAGTLVKSHSRIFDTVTPGEEAVVNVPDPGVLGVEKVSISVTRNVTDVTVDVTEQDGKPASVKVNVTGKVYDYLSINTLNLGNDDIENAEITFGVSKRWLENNSIPEEKVTLERYENGSWNELETSRASETVEKVKFTAETPGFSYFAVSGEPETQNETGNAGNETETQDQEQQDSTTDPKQDQEQDTAKQVEDQQEQEALVSQKVFLALSALLAVLVIATGVAYWKREEINEYLH